MIYKQPDAGGSWEHKSGDCATHGNNVAFAKPHKSNELYTCVQCMLSAAEKLSNVEAYLKNR